MKQHGNGMSAYGAFGSRLIAAMMLAVLAGSAVSARACPPEESEIEGVVHDILVDGDDGPIRLKMRARSEGLIRTASPEPHVLNLNLVSESDDVPMVTTRASTLHSFKWTGKDAAKEVQADYKDGAWTVKVDGKEVPGDRFSAEKNELVVKDETGKEIFRAPVKVDDVVQLSTSRNRLVPRLGGSGLFGGSIVTSTRPRLGITMNPVDESIVEHLGLPEGEYAEISAVTPGSAADEAGLKAKDVVVSIDDRSPANSEVISEVIRGKSVGDKIKLRVIRKGQPVELEAMLKKAPIAESVEMQSMPGAQAIPDGQAKLSDLSDRLAMLDKDLAARAEKLSADQAKKMKELSEKYGQLQGRYQVDGPGMKFAVPIGPDGQQRQIEVFTLPGEREKMLEDRLKVLEERLKQMDELLRRMDARLGGPSPVSPAPAVPALPAVPSVPSAPSSGGGGGGGGGTEVPKSSERLTLAQ